MWGQAHRPPLNPPLFKFLFLGPSIMWIWLSSTPYRQLLGRRLCYQEDVVLRQSPQLGLHKWWIFIAVFTTEQFMHVIIGQQRNGSALAR